VLVVMAPRYVGRATVEGRPEPGGGGCRRILGPVRARVRSTRIGTLTAPDPREKP
jgi:hypothetical protein